MADITKLINGRFEIIGEAVAIQGLEDCTDQRCTRLIEPDTGRDLGCMGYHCPDCLATCGMTGHRCPNRGEA